MNTQQGVCTTSVLFPKGTEELCYSRKYFKTIWGRKFSCPPTRSIISICLRRPGSKEFCPSIILLGMFFATLPEQMMIFSPCIWRKQSTNQWKFQAPKFLVSCCSVAVLLSPFVYFLLLCNSQGQLELSNAYRLYSQSSTAAFIGNPSHLLLRLTSDTLPSLNQCLHPMSQSHLMYVLNRPRANQIWPQMLTIFADKNNTPFFQDYFTAVCCSPSKLLDPYLPSTLKQTSFFDAHWSQSSKGGREGVGVSPNFFRDLLTTRSHRQFHI